MGVFKDITGKVINDFMVIKRVENKWGKSRWLCLCKCGKEVILFGSDFSKSSNTKMCRACFMKTFIRHGKTHTRIHKSWQDMKARCDNPKNAGYMNYGGRGIRYCSEWGLFDNFLKDMGEMPTESHTLERKDVDGDYIPSNCIWVTRKEQNLNKRTSRKIEFKGETKCLSQWCEIYNADYTLVFKRLQSGWPLEYALTTPSLGQNRGGITNNYKKRFLTNDL